MHGPEKAPDVLPTGYGPGEFQKWLVIDDEQQQAGRDARLQDEIVRPARQPVVYAGFETVDLDSSLDEREQVRIKQLRQVHGMPPLKGRPSESDILGRVADRRAPPGQAGHGVNGRLTASQPIGRRRLDHAEPPERREFGLGDPPSLLVPPFACAIFARLPYTVSFGVVNGRFLSSEDRSFSGRAIDASVDATRTIEEHA